jgi:Tol biopolymer transport system component
MPLSVGSRLGPYEIISLLGAGGMGEVYRAKDTKLGREVALKILPATFTNDPERLARFRREAQVLAALNHPHIGAIYGVDEAEGTQFLVLELVDGVSLDKRIARGPIPVDEALAIARQIAEALEAAHDKGIIHRDLKPANIALTTDGNVKVLDFGLAKATESASHTSFDVTNSPTITSPAMMTGVGVILGTAAYMSPEQAKGRPADRRSDIWAFGCVLFEMLTGHRAFDGEDVSDTLANVLKSEPNWTALPPDRSDLRTLLRRCLEKDRRRRLADIADVWFHLEEPPLVAAPSTRLRAPTLRLSTVGPFLVGLAIGAGALMYASLARHAPDGQVMRFSVALPDGWSIAAGVNPNGAAYGPLAVSADGRLIAMLARNSEGHVRLWIRQIDALTPRELPGTDGAAGPFWSPDSRFLGFFADGKLRKVDVNGGPPVPLCDTPSFNAASWSKDGVIVFARAGITGGPLLKVSAAGGVPSPATTLGKDETFHLRPAFLPDGRHFFYRAAGASLRSLYLASLDAPDRTLVFENPDASNVVYANGHLLFLREQTLMAQPFDTKRFSLSGEPVPIVEQVQTSLNVALFSASTTGVLAYVTAGAEAPSRLTWFDRSGNRTPGGIDSAGYGDLELSPDGERASMSVRASAGAGRDIWLLDLAGRVPSRFTFDPATELESVWSPDGTRIVFNRSRNGRLDLFEKTASGEGTEHLLFTDDVDKHPTSWSPDGKLLLYTAGGVGDLWILPMSGGEKPFPFIQTTANESQGQFSPDGRWVAYMSNESGFPQVYITSFPGPGGKRQVSTMRASQPRWRRDGRELYYLSAENDLIGVTVDVRNSALTIGPERRLFTFTPAAPRSSYAVAPDGRFLVNTTMVDTTPKPLPITVIVNWPRGLPQ